MISRKEGVTMHIHTITMKSHLTRTEYDTMEDFLFNVKTNDYGTVYPKNNSVLFHHHQGGFHLKLYRGKDANGYYHYMIYLTLNPYNMLNEKAASVLLF